jgi:hypothetical protein
MYVQQNYAREQNDTVSVGKPWGKGRLIHDFRTFVGQGMFNRTFFFSHSYTGEREQTEPV